MTWSAAAIGDRTIVGPGCIGHRKAPREILKKEGASLPLRNIRLEKAATKASKINDEFHLTQRTGRSNIRANLSCRRNAVAPDWVWALIAGGCIGYLLVHTGVVKVRRR
jgi:hypothetical protein